MKVLLKRKPNGISPHPERPSRRVPLPPAQAAVRASRVRRRRQVPVWAMASMPRSTSLAAPRGVTPLVTPIFSAFKRSETAARPTPSRRAASAGLFPSRINCKSVSSLIFFFAMDTSWKHHGNFWFTAAIAGSSLKMSFRLSAEKPGGEFERLQLNATNIFHSTTRAAKRDRET